MMSPKLLSIVAVALVCTVMLVGGGVMYYNHQSSSNAAAFMAAPVQQAAPPAITLSVQEFMSLHTASESAVAQQVKEEGMSQCQTIAAPIPPVVQMMQHICDATLDDHVNNRYIVGVPNSEAGFAHQTSNLLFAMQWAQACNYTYVHHPYQGHSRAWEGEIGFGSNCLQWSDVADNADYHVVDVPADALSHFHHRNPSKPPSCSAFPQLSPASNYKPGQKIVYRVVDKSAWGQCSLASTLRNWYWSGQQAMNAINTINSCWTLSVHIRSSESSAVYLHLLAKAKEVMSRYGPVVLQVFTDDHHNPSQLAGILRDFTGARVMNGTAKQDLDAMIRSDVFIHGVSGLSQVAALIGDGVKLSVGGGQLESCDATRWIYVQEDREGDNVRARFDMDSFEKAWDDYVQTHVSLKHGDGYPHTTPSPNTSLYDNPNSLLD